MVIHGEKSHLESLDSLTSNGFGEVFSVEMSLNVVGTFN